MKTHRFTLLQRAYLTLICRLAWLLVWLLNSTTRVHVEGLNRLEQTASQSSIIFSFWHNQIFSWSYLARFRNIVIIISRHFDGEFVARMISLFGFRTARGSSTQGGADALLELKTQLESGHDVAFTIDGPRGPIYKVKPGPLWLAGNTGFPILPVHVQPKHYWELTSWDRFRIPKPFTPILVIFGNPIRVNNNPDLDRWLPRFQATMEQLKDTAESFDWRTFQVNWNADKNHRYRYRSQHDKT